MLEDTTITITGADGEAVDITDRVATLTTAPANRFAAGWLNVFTAAGTDDGATDLAQAIQVEVHDDWVRLIASDSYTVHVATIARSTDETIDELDLDLEPAWSVRVHDFDGRAKALMGWLHSATKKDEWAEVSFWVGSMEDPNQPTLLPQLARRGLVLDAGHERVWLPINDGPALEWKGLFATGEDDPEIASVALSAEFLARPAKFKNADGALLFAFDGRLRPVTFRRAGNPTVHGLIMPVRTGEPGE